MPFPWQKGASAGLERHIWKILKAPFFAITYHTGLQLFMYWGCKPWMVVICVDPGTLLSRLAWVFPFQHETWRSLSCISKGAILNRWTEGTMVRWQYFISRSVVGFVQLINGCHKEISWRSNWKVCFSVASFCVSSLTAKRNTKKTQHFKFKMD